MESLIDVLEATDFGVFVFAPDDVLVIRDQTKSAVRDNVIFEIGLFMGRLGRERTFLVVPRGWVDLRLPTDLLGITPAEYEAQRQDGNLVAAVGPACPRIRRAIEKFGAFTPTAAVSPVAEQPVTYDENDIKAILTSWMGSRPSGKNTRVIRFRDTDAELKIPDGSTAKYIAEIATRWNYRVLQRGTETILFEEAPGGHSGPHGWMAR